MSDLHPETLAVHAGEHEDPVTGAVDPPLVLATTYAFPDAAEAAARFQGSSEGYIYSRWKNPTVEAFEAKMAALEGAEAAVALSSGMGAVYATVCAHVRAGDHVVAPEGVYAETLRLLRGPLARFDVSVTAVDMTDLDAVAAALTPRTRLVWVETPANPTLSVYDVGSIAERAHGVGALVVVDNTFATPFHQTPLQLGADVVVHSATKAIGGHGDAVGGVACGGAQVMARVREDAVRSQGNVMAPMTAWLLSRGVRTLALRQERASATALELARRLAEDRRVARVCYPGLAADPFHALAARQMRRGFGALLAFEVEGGAEAGRAAYDGLGLVTRAVSLGDVRTLVTHPATTTHASLTPAQRAAAGIGEGLMRLSVGIEHVEDLWADLDQALSSASRTSP